MALDVKVWDLLRQCGKHEILIYSDRSLIMKLKQYRLDVVKANKPRMNVYHLKLWRVKWTQEQLIKASQSN